MLSRRFVARANERPGESRDAGDTSRKKGAHRPRQTMRSEYPRLLSFCRLFPKERSIFLGDLGETIARRKEKKRKEKKKTEKGPCRVCPASLDDFAGSRKISSAFERRGRGGGGEGEGEERKSNVAISLIFQGIREWVLRGSRFLKISLITSTRHVKPPWRRVFALRSHEVRRAFFCCPSTTGLPILAAFDSAE